MARAPDPRQGDLLQWQPQPVAVGYADDVPGKGTMDTRIVRTLSRALRDARDDRDLGREQIADDMTRRLGRKVTVDQLNKWTSEAAGSHRIPLDAFVALALASGAEELVGFIAAEFGLCAVPSRYAAIIELHQIEEKEAQLAELKSRVTIRVRQGQ